MVEAAPSSGGAETDSEWQGRVPRRLESTADMLRETLRKGLCIVHIVYLYRGERRRRFAGKRENFSWSKYSVIPESVLEKREKRSCVLLCGRSRKEALLLSQLNELCVSTYD